MIWLYRADPLLQSVIARLLTSGGHEPQDRPDPRQQHHVNPYSIGPTWDLKWRLDDPLNNDLPAVQGQLKEKDWLYRVVIHSNEDKVAYDHPYHWIPDSLMGDHHGFSTSLIEDDGAFKLTGPPPAWVSSGLADLCRMACITEKLGRLGVRMDVQAFGLHVVLSKCMYLDVLSLTGCRSWHHTQTTMIEILRVRGRLSGFESTKGPRC